MTKQIPASLSHFVFGYLNPRQAIFQRMLLLTLFAVVAVV